MTTSQLPLGNGLVFALCAEFGVEVVIFKQSEPPVSIACRPQFDGRGRERLSQRSPSMEQWMNLAGRALIPNATE